MRPLVIGCALGGITLMVILVLSSSPVTILATLATSTGPVAAASLFRTVPLLLYAISWRALIPPASRPRFLTLMRLRWIGESVNALLPVAQVGGDLARARLLAQTGAPGPVAAASMVADIGIGAASQVMFTVIGVVALSLHGAVGQLAGAIALACVLTAAGAGALLAVAHVGVSRILNAMPILRRTGAAANGLFAHAANVDQAIAAVATRRGDLVRAFVWHLAGWISQVFETWLVLHMISPGVSWLAALVIESLALIARSAAFIVPGGFGVQEGALILVGGHFGIDASMALSLGIIKRLREVVVGTPAIVAWSIAERHFLDKLWRRTTRREGGDS